MRRLQTVRSFLRWERWDLLGEMINMTMIKVKMMVLMVMTVMVMVRVEIGAVGLIG